MIKVLTHSLRARLIAGFILLTVIAWFGASVAAWLHTIETLDELFDTRQMLFARRLSVLDMNALRPEPGTELPDSKKMLPHHRGRQDDDTLAFAIYTTDGRLVLNDGDHGKDLVYNYQHDGFINEYLQSDDDDWRLVWMTTPDERYRIVVGQEIEYREDLALDIISSQLMPWLIALPLMLIMLIWLVNRALSPLHNLAAQLRHRSPDDDAPLPVEPLPMEVKPLIASLNQLFARTGAFMLRERRFTSDAAHELRSPLAALKVQAEVAQLAESDEPVRVRALHNLTLGIDRATRLVDQLLTLSRLDSLADLDDIQSVSLHRLLQSAVMDAYHQAQRAGVDIRLEVRSDPAPRKGEPLLLSLMVRNILDNAVRYTPPGSVVNVVLLAHEIRITDNGPGIATEYLSALGRRFFRPPGQEKTGSGLGLSIVERIAALHDMTAHFSNAQGGGFQVSITW